MLFQVTAAMERLERAGCLKHVANLRMKSDSRQPQPRSGRPKAKKLEGERCRRKHPLTIRKAVELGIDTVNANVKVIFRFAAVVISSYPSMYVFFCQCFDMRTQISDVCILENLDQPFFSHNMCSKYRTEISK